MAFNSAHTSDYLLFSEIEKTEDQYIITISMATGA